MKFSFIFFTLLAGALLFGCTSQPSDYHPLDRVPEFNSTPPVDFPIDVANNSLNNSLGNSLNVTPSSSSPSAYNASERHVLLNSSMQTCTKTGSNDSVTLSEGRQIAMAQCSNGTISEDAYCDRKIGKLAFGFTPLQSGSCNSECHVNVTTKEATTVVMCIG